VLREPIDLDRVPPGTSHGVRQLLARCLERDPKRRLRDIGEARIAIDDVIANPVGESGPTTPAAPRRTWALAVPWALAAILLVALLAGSMRSRQSVLPSTASLAAFDIDLGGLTLQRGGQTGGFVALSRDGRRLVIAAGPRREGASGEAEAQQRLYQRTIDRLAFSPIPGTEESMVPFISPNGEWVGFFAQGQLRKVAFGGGVPIRICDLGAPIPGAAWLDDDTIVFASDGQLFEVPAGGGTPRILAGKRSDNATYIWPAGIPGGRGVLFALRLGGTFSGAVRIGVLDRQTKRETTLADNGSYPRFMNGFVLFAQQTGNASSANSYSGGVLALPFDAERLVSTGPPVAVLTDVRVHGGGAANFDTAADGTVAFVAGGVEQLDRAAAWYRMGPDLALTGTAEPIAGSGGGNLPHLSNDDRAFVVQMIASNSVAVYNLDRGVAARVPFDGMAVRPIFGPAGGMVTVWSESRRGLWLASTDGSRNAEQLTSVPTSQVQVPGTWTRDGKTLVLTQFEGGAGNIATIRRGEQSATPFVASNADERDPALSFDDRWVAYASNESGQYNVFVRPFDGSGGRYAVSNGGGLAPVWSKDGRQLYFVGPAGLMVVDVTASQSFAATTPRLIRGTETWGFRPRRGNLPHFFTSRTYDVTRDGRILYTVDQSNEDVPNLTSLRMMLHFDGEIRRRTAPGKP